MRVIVGCGFSQVVTTAFRQMGHEAYSCDILPSEGGHPEWHFQRNILEVIKEEEFDLGIFHPSCTYLCSSGMHWTTRGLRDPQLTEDALEFVRALLGADIKHIALENPIGCISTRIRKPDQIIQPWMFGHDASKATCLWLKNLPVLQPTDIIPPKGFQNVVYASDLPLCECCEEPWCEKHQEHYSDCDCYGPTQDDLRYIAINKYEFACDMSFVGKPVWSNQTPSGQNKLGPSEDRWAARSVTYKGIADAMSQMWGKLC